MAHTAAWYRDKKKRLNKIHNFTFKMPRKGKDFSPAQKTALTRLWGKHGDSIAEVEKGNWSFIKKRKGVGLKNIPQVAKTNAGIFYNKPGAKVTKKKRGEKSKLEVIYKKVREFYIPFPKDIQGNMDLIQIFVEGCERLYKPDYILWAIYGNMATVRYSPELFQRYASELMMDAQFSKDMRQGKKDRDNFLSGVFFGYLPKGSK